MANIELFGLTIDENGALQALKKTEAASSHAADKVIADNQRVGASTEGLARLRQASEARVQANLKQIDDARGQNAAAAVAKQQQRLAAEEAAIQRRTRATEMGAEREARAMGLLEIAAYKENEAIKATAISQEAAAVASGTHGLQLGRLRMELGTLTGRLTGTSTALDRMAGALGGMALGDPLVIGVLAGIAAIAYAWHTFTAESREDSKRAEESIKSLSSEIRKAQEAMGDLALAAAQKNVSDVALGKGGGIWSMIMGGFTASGQGRAGAAVTGVDPQNAEYRKRLNEANAILLQAQLNKTAIDTAIRNEAEKSYADNLALLVSHNQATAAERARALDLYKRNAAEIAALAKSQTDNVRRAMLIEQNDVLKGALFPTDRQGEQEFKRELQQRMDEYNHFVKDQQAAYKRASEEAVRDFERQQDEETSIALQQQNEQTRNAKEAYKQQSEAAVHEFEAQQRYQEEIQKIWLRGIEQITTRGITSFKSFFDEVLHLFQQLMARMEKEGETGNAFKALGLGTIGIGSGIAGYGIGASTQGNRGSAGLFGALGGAASGAAAGSVIPGIGTAIGATVGSIAGLVGGIIGAGHAADLSAHEMENLQKSLTTSIADVKAQLAGDTLGSAILQVHAQFDALRKAAEDAYATGKNEAQRNVVLAELNKLEAQRTEQLRAEFALQQQQAQEDYKVRLLVAQGHQEEADALAFAEQQQREYAAAVKAGADATTLAALAAAQSAEASKRTEDLIAAAKKAADDAALAAAQALEQAAKAAADAAAQAEQKARDQQRAYEDLNVELLRAQGRGTAADDMQFQLEQQRRLDEAKASQTDAYVQKLLELQQLQRDQRAAQGLIDSTSGRALSTGATSALTAVSATVTQRTALMIVDILRAIEVNTRTTSNSAGGLTVRITNTYQLGSDDAQAIKDEFAREIDAVLGNRQTLATRFAGSVMR